MKFSVCISLTFLFLAEVASGFTRDTLSYFDPKTASVFYRDAGITAQAARFDLGAPAFVRKLKIWLAGRTTGTASVRIYGNEGSFSAPLLNLPFSQTITIEKSKPGVQKIEVELPPDIFIDRPQFFVVVEDLSNGIRLLSDRQEKLAVCADVGERWTYQAIRGSDNIWRVGKYGYAIEAVVDYPEAYTPSYLQDITSEAFDKANMSSFEGDQKDYATSERDSLEPSRSIAFGDLDQNGLVDLMTAGKLWLNVSEPLEGDGNQKFKEITDRLGTEEQFRAGHFIDVDNDSDLDIMLLGFSDGTSQLLLNDGDGYFTGHQVRIPEFHNPISLAIADADADGFLDLYLVQGLDTSGQELSSYLLQNQGGRSFVPLRLSAEDISAKAETGQGIQAAQWIDYNVDGNPDLYLTGITAKASRLWLNNGVKEGNGRGRFTQHPGSLFPAQSTGATSTNSTNSFDSQNATSDWVDHGNDGNPDLLQPLNVGRDNLNSIESEGSLTPYFRSFQTSNFSLLTSFAGSGTWADVNNDGNLDALITSSCDCRFATLYTQNVSGEFQEKSFEYGLFRVPAGADAVWVDFNNDGKLDLATFVHEEFRLYKNTGHFQNNYVGFDLQGSTRPSEVAGATITLYSGETRQSRPVVSGRGALMQGPLRVHFGLKNLTTIDSVVVELANGGERHLLKNPEINKLHRLFDPSDTKARGDAQVDLSVRPNPFKTYLRFSYTLSKKSHVRIELYSLDGELLAVPVNQEQGSGLQTREWRATDKSGQALPAGTYIWRAIIGNRRLTGRAILIE